MSRPNIHHSPRSNVLCRGLFLALAVLPALGVLAPRPVAAQDAPSERRRVELGFGLATPLLHGGSELLRARKLRDQEWSYFEGADGSRRSVGSYPRLLGFSVHLGFHHPVERVEGLTLGAAARTSLTGSQPAEGGYSEGYFFNSVTLALAARHHPSAHPRLFLVGETGLGSVLTKNRYHDEVGAQGYFHQFGIGPAGSAGIGYALRPLGDGAASLDIQLLYQYLHTRVEVEGVGDDRWRAGMLHLVVGTAF